MSRKFRGRAIAAAAMMFVLVVVGAQGSGAFAQTIQSTPQTQTTATETAPAAGMPVFVAQEVVQPLPEPATDTLAALVDTVTVTGDLSDDMRCLAEAVYFEARGEPLEGQLAVAKVVINRANSGYYPSDYCSVVTQPAQFSFVRRGVIPRANESSAAWHRAQAIAQIAQQGLWDCEADDALFFHATYVQPRWAHRKTMLAKIDTHIFYR